MKATTFLILTVLGDDRPGLVERLAATVAEHEGNWLESAMSHLSGKFAGIVRVALPAQRLAALRAALAAIDGLTITAEVANAFTPANGRHLNLTLVGHDRRGIVRELSQVLARHGVNVEELTTHTTSAPMAATLLFHAAADLLAPMELDVRALQRDLEQISNDLMVDITLGETL